MRKRFSLLLVIMLMLVTVLAACAGGQTAEPTPGETPNTETPAPETPEAPAEDATQNDGLFEATDMSQNPPTATERKDTLIVGVTSPKGVFNPLFQDSAYDDMVNVILFDGFQTINGDGTYSLHLADSIDVSENGLKYTFKLKPGVTYTDGTPVTVNDFYFSLKVLHDKSYDGPSDALSYMIKGGQDYYDGKASEISGVTIVDENTVEVEVTEVTALTKDFLGGITFLPEAYYGKDYKQGNVEPVKALNDKPLGSGQYIMKSFQPGQQVILEANENYFAGAPKIKNVIYKSTTDETKLAMLNTGEIDMDMVTVNEDNIEELQSYGFLNINVFPTNGYGYVGINHEKEKFKDAKVRQALVYGLNRAEIVEAVYGKFADVINIPQSKQSWAYTDEGIEAYAFDTEKAKSLLDEAGWTVGADGTREKDGEKLTIDFSGTADNPVVDAILPIMTANYQDLGIKLNAEKLDFNAILDKTDKGDFDMFFMAWGLTPDPDGTVYTTGGAQNRVKYSNEAYDALMKQGKKELDPDKRKEIYAQAYQELNKDIPDILMYQRRDAWAVNGRVTGLEITPYKDFTYSLYQAELAQ
ncbi:ABC transporter substrate-binding protein [Paenibacillus sp. An7]|uniref:ABC transporter substrate-binding protein n=1 Tax=Paenibacillus sp. An7 TaxID=2689577 RepID=UPI00135882F7|nr:ABC transporter substrate-binding protein [Paenibacillus sp. An7]